MRRQGRRSRYAGLPLAYKVLFSWKEANSPALRPQARFSRNRRIAAALGADEMAKPRK